MRIIVGLLLAIALVAAGAWFGQYYHQTSPILITNLVANMQDDTVVEHERDMVIWYRTCPKKIHWHDISPEILVIFPSTVRYELSLQNISLPELVDGEWIVEAGPIIADKPVIDTNRQTSLADGNPLTDEGEYLNRETARMTPIASYLALQQLQSEQNVIRKRMTLQIEKLIQSMQNASQLANNRNTGASLSQNSDYPVRVNWNEDKQQTYLETAIAELSIAPPFGIQGCKNDEWLQINGHNSGIALISPNKKPNPRGGATKKSDKKQSARYIFH